MNFASIINFYIHDSVPCVENETPLGSKVWTHHRSLPATIVSLNSSCVEREGGDLNERLCGFCERGELLGSDESSINIVF